MTTTSPAVPAVPARAPSGQFDPRTLIAAIPQAMRKLDPRHLWHTPVMFVVWVGSVMTTVASLVSPSVFSWGVTIWLWATVIFANLAESVAEDRGRAQAASLRATRQGTIARRLLPDGTEDSVPATELGIGDLVVCEAGDRIPGDGDIVEGIASVDESAITGESAPVIRESGGDRSAVTGGTKVLSDRIVVKISVRAGETFIDRMIGLVEGANRKKTPNEVALNILLAALTIVFLLVVMTLVPLNRYSGADQDMVVLIALLVCLIPTTIGALLAAIGIAGRWTIADGENAFALVVLVTVGVVVAAVVDRSAARLEAANRSQAEAAVLAAMSTGVLTRQDGVRGLLEQACETFRMSGATLFEGDAGEPLRDPRAIEAFGAQAPRAPDDADVVVEAGPGLTLALTGRPLRASDRRLLNAFAQQTAAVLERNRLAVRASDAQRLREVDATRTALLQAVSHDLRTPLAGLKTSLETLADPQLDLPDSERNQLVADALASTGRLESMVLNLLDLSRLQAGGLRPQLAEASLAEVITAATAGLGADMISDETPEVLPLLVTDAALLERILANLLANALQHSEPGALVRISASAVPADRVAIRVIDRGAGVPDRAKTRMFEPFQRLDDTGSGVGLGLAVARGLAASIGAEIEAEDTPGGGLTMVVTVPAVPGTGESA